MTDQEIKTKIIPMAKGITEEVKKAVIGKDEIVIKTLLAIIAGGHILLDDIPGVGKTTLALAFSKAMSLDYKRMQFTPDVLPADVTGFTVYNKRTDSFDYKPGAALCSLFLADEINRTSSKTQSALLEAMEEGSVTVDGCTHPLPKPFIVIATQNPIGSVGTQMLPESQLDRFIVRLTMGYPDLDSEIAILKSKGASKSADSISPAANADDVLMLISAAEEVFIDDRVYKCGGYAHPPAGKAGTESAGNGGSHVNGKSRSPYARTWIRYSRRCKIYPRRRCGAPHYPERKGKGGGRYGGGRSARYKRTDSRAVHTITERVRHEACLFFDNSLLCCFLCALYGRPFVLSAGVPAGNARCFVRGSRNRLCVPENKGVLRFPRNRAWKSGGYKNKPL